MTKRSIGSALATTMLVAGVGCGAEPNRVETGLSALTSATSAVRGYTRPAVPPAVGQHAIVYQDPTGRIGQNVGTPPSTTFNLGGNLCFGCSPWGYLRSDLNEAVLYLDANRHVHEITFSSIGSVFDADFVSQLGAPVADSESPTVPDVIGYVRSDGVSAIVYRSGGKIIEISRDFPHGGAWVVSNLSDRSGSSMRVQKGTPFPYVRTDGVNDIIYVGTDNHIREMWNYQGSSSWAEGDLSAAVGDLASPGSSPWGYRRSDQYNAVVFVDTGRNLHEFALKPGSPCSPSHYWCAGAFPGVDADPFRPSGYVRADGISTVVYKSGNSIREHALVSGAWQDSAFALPPNYSAMGEPFGHLPPTGLGSVLFEGQDGTTGDVKAVQLYLPDSSGWTASVIEEPTCNGPQHLGCSTSGTFCELASGACATTINPIGVCFAKPTSCDHTIVPVCGCDGVSYANDCERRAAGVSKWADGVCSSSSCPPAVPVSLTSCAPENISCTYSVQESGKDCAERLTCSSGQWSAPVVVCPS